MDFIDTSCSDDEDENLEKLNQVLEQEQIGVINKFGSIAPAQPAQHISIPTQAEKLAGINKTLAYNHAAEEMTNLLEKRLASKLLKCRQQLQHVRLSISSSIKDDKVKANFRYRNCGRPYFRDSQNFPAPENEDTKIVKSEMFDFSLPLSVAGWTVRDKSQFITLIHKMSVDIKEKQINSKIAEIKRKHKGEQSLQVKDEIARLQAEAENMSKKPLSKLALPIDEEYDWDLIANQLNGRHTAQEYQSLWKLYSHPSINKNKWNKEEHDALQQIAVENNYQDWNDIAKKLNTSRTGYQCFVYYRTNITNPCSGKKWTPEEITYLKRLIEYYKEGSYIPWSQIAAEMEPRTKIQIYNKYIRLNEQRKGRFLPEEDAVILNCVKIFGTNYKRIATYLSGRSKVQIRARYKVLSKMRVSIVWTIEEDRKLIQLMTSQDSMNFSMASQQFPGKNRVNIRSRYVTLMKWMKENPNMDLIHAPRRGPRRLNHGHATDNLHKALEDLKCVLNKEVEKKSKKKEVSLISSSETEIENAIVNLVFNELSKKKDYSIRKDPNKNQQVHLGINQVVTSDNVNVSEVRKCLILLNSSLNQNDFLKSKYSTQYPNLGDYDPDVCSSKIKSYSRKNAVETIEYSNSPNVWGTKTLLTSNYVLPPHYATINGCRALLSLVNSSDFHCESANLKILAKRNSIFQNQMDQLLERTHKLFTWPMILSNNEPSVYNNKKAKRNLSIYEGPLHAPSAPKMAVDVGCMNVKKYINKVTEVIDLHIQGDKDKQDKGEEKQDSEDNLPECPLFK